MSCSSVDILMINPWIYDFAAYDFWLKPLGFLSIASILRENCFNINFIDCLDRYHPRMLSRIKRKKLRKNKQHGHGQFFKEKIKKPDRLASVPRYYSRYGIHPDIFRDELKKLASPPDAVLITTTMTYWYPGTYDTIRIVREIFPKTSIIIGGNYVTLCPDHALHLGADYYIQGNGEKKILNLLSRITGKTISYPPDEDNLDQLPYPAFDLLKERDYICMQTTRGCPFKCSYCAVNLLSNGIKRLSPARVVSEIVHWVKCHGVKNIVFYDDALLFQPEEHIIPILMGTLEKGLKNICFHTPNGLHARFISKKLADLMFKTGFRTIRLGYETADPLKQIQTGGKVNTEELEAALAFLKEAGFLPADLGVYILIGLPGQKIKEVEESINKVVKLGGIPILTEFSPIPDTAIWEESLHYSNYDLANDPIFHNNSILPCQWSGFTWEDYLNIKSQTSLIRRDINKKNG
ncbi:MAG: B12-binding domain-containing radical SAM protein [bacterium]